MGPLFGRYVLEMKMTITISRSGTRIVKHEDPRYSLWEFHRVKEWWDEDHPKSMDATTIASFGLEEWETLMRNNGDWKSIGIELKRDSPVEGFDRYWKTEQREHTDTTIPLE